MEVQSGSTMGGGATIPSSAGMGSEDAQRQLDDLRAQLLALASAPTAVTRHQAGRTLKRTVEKKRNSGTEKESTRLVLHSQEEAERTELEVVRSERDAIQAEFFALKQHLLELSKPPAVVAAGHTAQTNTTSTREIGIDQDLLLNKSGVKSKEEQGNGGAAARHRHGTLKLGSADSVLAILREYEILREQGAFEGNGSFAPGNDQRQKRFRRKPFWDIFEAAPEGKDERLRIARGISKVQKDKKFTLTALSRVLRETPVSQTLDLIERADFREHEHHNQCVSPTNPPSPLKI
ncbi:hypothetical protein FVE85_0294 [Porphyridium purpureum]|uniref:Uncharacterized protein n=1 Tax=Porphyridium purpureum TaxID=35688 RepID=A0A5J4YZL2_PORPP|nr:hypothetical protein FVE85_0294 [Porphyridium purpureum]|eukprot:POR1601..scf208_2